MARTIRSGSLTFGLVSLPISVAAATASHTIRFHQLERGTSDRVRNKRVNERTGEEVPYDRTVKGYDTGEGEYVLVEPEELIDISPGRSSVVVPCPVPVPRASDNFPSRFAPGGPS